MKDGSDTRTEIIGGAFFVRKKKSHRSERKKGKKCGSLFMGGQSAGPFALAFSGREIFCAAPYG